MNTYTIKELNNFELVLNESSTVSEFIEKAHVNEYTFKDLLSELIETKIGSETKLRKKRVKKFIDYYNAIPDAVKNVLGAVEFLNNKYESIDKNDDNNKDIKLIIKEIYSTKKIQCNDETVEFYLKDLKEFFNLFSPNTTLNEILKTYK